MDTSDVVTSTGERRHRVCAGSALATIILAVTAITARGGAAQPDSSPPAETRRVIVALLPFEDRTDEPNLASWRYMSPGLLRNQLSHVKALRLRCEGAVRYGLRQASISPGDALDPNHARAVGEHIEAQRVIWGSYSRENEQLRVEARTALRESLRNGADAIPAAFARHLIAQINEKIGFDVSPAAEPPESKSP